MHTVDHRGVCSIIAGSLLVELVRKEPRLGTNQAERMQSINVFIDAYYAVRPVSCRIPEIRLENLTLGSSSSALLQDWAVLHGPVVKAANTRHLSPVLDELAIKYFDSDSEEDIAVRSVCCELCHFYHILYNSPMFLSDATKAELKTCLLTLGRNMQKLNAFSVGRGELSWWISPKVHYMQHFEQQADLINPRYTQCYAEESLMGRIAKIWRATAVGQYANIEPSSLDTSRHLWCRSTCEASPVGAFSVPHVLLQNRSVCDREARDCIESKRKKTKKHILNWKIPSSSSSSGVAILASKTAVTISSYEGFKVAYKSCTSFR